MTDPADPLDDALREHYASQSLDAAAIARLRRTIHRPRLTPWFSRVAAVLLVACIAGVYGWSQYAAHVSRVLTAEAARQHRQTFAADIDAQDFRQLQDRMPALGFQPIEPQRCRQDDYRVIGARYATLAGKTAVQIRLAYVEGEPLSLYELPADQLPHVRDGTVDVNGTPVTVWRENGLLMALAGTPVE